MKKLCIFLILMAAVALSLSSEPAEAINPWKVIQVCDSIDAETADTFYVDFTDYGGVARSHKSFRLMAMCSNNQSGDTDGRWYFDMIYGDVTGSNFYDLEVFSFGATAGAAYLLAYNTEKTMQISMTFDDELQPGYYGVMGDSLRVIWDPQNVTGGEVSLYLWYQVIK